MMEQPKPNGRGREITPLVIADLMERTKRGRETYGENLRAFNGRSALGDLYDEILDAAQYIRQVIEEREWLDRAATAEDGCCVTAGTMSDADNESALLEAHRLVHGDRGEAYGHPLDDMTRTAEIVTPLLRDKLRPGAKLSAEDISKMMVGVKLSRETNRPRRDNRVDGAGYFETLDMIVEERARRIANGESEWHER